MINAEIVIDNVNWKKKLKNTDLFINKILKSFPKKYQYNGKKVILTVLLSNNKKIKKLNKKFRKKNKSTDVLSFPFYEKKQLNNKIKKEKEIYLGDIIINLNEIKNKNNKNKFQEGLNKLWVHGLVHLFGYRHKKDNDFYAMNKIEQKYLEYIN